jgi:hypothetical protein
MLYGIHEYVLRLQREVTPLLRQTKDPSHPYTLPTADLRLRALSHSTPSPSILRSQLGPKLIVLRKVPDDRDPQERILLPATSSGTLQ